MNAVVAPVARSRKLCDRHQLDGGDPEVDQPIEVGDDGFESARGREHAHVQLVEHEIGERVAGEALVGPREDRGIHDGGEPVHAVGLPARDRIRPIALAVETILVACARGQRPDHGREEPVALFAHGESGTPVDDEVQRSAARSPRREGHRAGTNACAQRAHTVQ